MFMCFLDFAELLELLFILLLLFSISVNDVDCIIEVVLNLSHLPGYHLLHLLIIFYHAFCRSVLDLAHNFVQDLSLELLLEVLVNCSQPWESFQITAQQALIVTLQALLELCFGLLCSIFNLLERCQRTVPNRLLVLELSRVVKEFFQSTIELNSLLNVGVVEDFITESLVVYEDGLRAVFGTCDSVTSILQLRAGRSDGAFFEAKDLTRAQNSELNRHS